MFFIVILLFSYLLIILEIFVDLFFDLLFRFVAEGVNGDHILEQADPHTAGDAADVDIFEYFPDTRMRFEYLVDRFVAKIAFQIHAVVSFPFMLKPDYRLYGKQNMT